MWKELYTPFGLKWTNPAANRDSSRGRGARANGYTGHIEDAASGLTYMQARYYDPALGRFLANDPVGFAEGGPGYFNRYAYTLNNPMSYIDPNGMCAVLKALSRSLYPPFSTPTTYRYNGVQWNASAPTESAPPITASLAKGRYQRDFRWHSAGWNKLLFTSAVFYF
ncbi:MAG: RHS repeat-associated core domain-containing protein [Pseudomonadota bacterium]